MRAPLPSNFFPLFLRTSPGVPRRLCADAAVALGAGVLPCVTHKLARMTLGPAGGAVWCPPDRFPGTVHCWLEWMLFGPTTQVGELLSVLDLKLSHHMTIHFKLCIGYVLYVTKHFHSIPFPSRWASCWRSWLFGSV